MYSFSRIKVSADIDAFTARPITRPLYGQGPLPSMRPEVLRTSEWDLLGGEDETIELASDTADALSSVNALPRGDDTQDLVDPSAVPAQAAVPELPESSEPSACAAPSPETPHQRSVFETGGTVRGRYVLERPIAAGGSSIVYLARDLRRTNETGSPYVALKVIRPDFPDIAKAGERLKHEYTYTSGLSHPNIVRVFDLDVEGGIWFMTLEYLEGDSLQARLHRSSPAPLTEDQALGILRGCAEALMYAHERGVLHCDFKPSNVLVGDAREVRLVDFGAACAVSCKNTDGNKLPVSATPAYASPELLNGQRVDARTDVFSLGCVAYELFAGRHAFDGLSALEMLSKGARPPRPTTLSSTRWRAIDAALNWDREQRPGSIREFMRLFEKTVPAATKAPVTVKAAAVAAAIVTALVATTLAYRSQGAKHRVASSAAAPHLPSHASSHGLEQLLASVKAHVAERSQSGLFASLRGAEAGFLRRPHLPAFPMHTMPMDRKAAVRVTSPVSIPNTVESSGTISLEQSKISVSERSIAAVLTVRRTGGRKGRLTFQWRTLSGSARPGLDYENIAAETAVLADNQPSRALFVPLKAPGSRHKGARSFEVELRSSSSANLGAINRAVVTIQ